MSPPKGPEQAVTSCCRGNYLVGSAPQKRCALIPLLCSAWAGSHPESLGRVRTLHCKGKSVQNVGKPEETRKNKELQNQPSGERLLELLDRGKIKGWYMKGSFSVAREKLYVHYG